MRTRGLHVWPVLLSLAGAAAGCRDMGSEPEPTPPPPAATVSFSQQVLPILQQSGCTGCHGGNGGLFVGTVQQLLQGGVHGPAVVPGNGNGSLLIQKLSLYPPFGDRMPQGGPYLPEATVSVIRTWIDQGAQDN